MNYKELFKQYISSKSLDFIKLLFILILTNCCINNLRTKNNLSIVNKNGKIIRRIELFSSSEKAEAKEKNFIYTLGKEDKVKNPNAQSLILTLSTSCIMYSTNCLGSYRINVTAGSHVSIYPSILKYSYETADYKIESCSNPEQCYRCYKQTSILGDVSFPFKDKHIRDLRASYSVCNQSQGGSISYGNNTTSSYLINFEITIVSAGGMNEIQFTDNGIKYCLLPCHRRGDGPGKS